jgi:hypothetical protein
MGPAERGAHRRRLVPVVQGVPDRSWAIDVLLVSPQGRIAVVKTKLALIEVYGSVKIKFRPTKCARAIGEEGGRRYREVLERVAPSAMKMDYPGLPRSEAARVALQSFELVGSEDLRPGRSRSPPCCACKRHSRQCFRRHHSAPSHIRSPYTTGFSAFARHLASVSHPVGSDDTS